MKRMKRHKSIVKWGGITLLCLMMVGMFIQINQSSFNLEKSTSSVTPPDFTTDPESATDPESTFNDIIIKNLHRVMYLVDSGILDTEDEYAFYNNGSSTISAVYIGFRNEYIDNLYYYQASDLGGSQLQIYPIGKLYYDYHLFAIILNEPLYPYSFKNITVELTFSQIHTLDTLGLGNYSVDIPFNPISPYPVYNFFSKVELPHGSYDIHATQLEDYDIGPSPSAEGASTTLSRAIDGDIPNPFENIHTNIIWNNPYLGPIKITEVNRVIDINPAGYIRIRENHVLFSQSPGSVSKIMFLLNSKYYDVSVYDDLGAISGLSKDNLVNPDGSVEFTLDLDANRAKLVFGRQMSFTVEYYIKYDDIHTKNLGEHNIHFDLLPLKSEIVMEKVSTIVNIMNAQKIIRLNTDPDKIIKSFSGIQLKFYAESISQEHILQIDINYKVSFIKPSNIFRSIYELYCSTIL